MKIVKFALASIVAVGMSVGFCSLLFDAMEREAAARDELRAERCAKWGEDTPEELQPYCDNLGV